MTNTLEHMRRKISGAEQLDSVVRTMKAQAASNITQYENAVLALGDYYRTVELGLTAYFCQNKTVAPTPQKPHRFTAIIFGSDQGLVGTFNDQLGDSLKKHLAAQHHQSQTSFWTVGERICDNLTEAGLSIEKSFDAPSSITAITALVGQILKECVENRTQDDNTEIRVFYNRLHASTVYEPTSLKLLPLDKSWQNDIASHKWPHNNMPELIECPSAPILRALIHEFLFISLYRACAESLASENASRLAAMQRAEKNISALMIELKQTSRILRQNVIDEELFDVIAAFKGY